MPIVFKNELAGKTVALWRISESVEQLLAAVSLSEDNRQILSKLKTLKRQNEWLAWHAAVEQLTGFEGVYDQFGRPHLSVGECQLSVAHGGDYVAVIVSQHRCGIDLERVTRDVSKVKNRYLSDAEYNLLQSVDCGCESALLGWCLKEAAFKYGLHDEVDFMKDLKIVGTEDDCFVMQLFDTECVRLSYSVFDGHVVAWI